ncbi:MAG: hypothetical protein K8T25_19380 [Planctomycetia bacterium]|nr:hypothetical protein [Planctomycetia bacterium]
MINYQAVASMPRGRTRHVFIDAEPSQARWLLVVRGEDYATIGRTNKPEIAELRWNEIDGDHRRYIVAESENKTAIVRLAREVAGYFNGTPISDLSAESARLSLALVQRFGRFQADGIRRCGPYLQCRMRPAA